MIGKEKKTKSEIVCVRNAHYKDTGEVDENGNKLKIFVEARYIEKDTDYYVYTFENKGEVHEFMDYETAKEFEKDCEI